MDNCRIGEVLYDEKTRKSREVFHQERINFLKSQEDPEHVYLASFNIKINSDRDEEQ